MKERAKIDAHICRDEKSSYHAQLLPFGSGKITSALKSVLNFRIMILQNLKNWYLVKGWGCKETKDADIQNKLRHAKKHSAQA